jgi:hypothetical protein
MDPLPAAWASEPIAEQAAAVYGDLDVPLWSANQSMGQPLLATGNPNVVSPLRAPLIFFPQATVWDLFLIARVFFAALFTFLLARRLGMMAVSAFGAATAFAFSGYFMLFINMPNADSAMMTPVILYAFELLLSRPRPLTIILAAFATAVSVVANNPESGVLLVLFGSAYYLYRSIISNGWRHYRRIIRSIMPLAAAGVSGAALTAFYLVPFIEFTGVLGIEGYSLHRHTSGAGLGTAFTPLDGLISLLVPYFKGATRRSFETGGWTGIRTYSGMVVVVLAVAAFWHRDQMKASGWFFLGGAAVLTAKWHGLPVINDFGRLPVLNLIEFTQYGPPFISLSIAMLAGIGIDSIALHRGRWFHIAAGVAVLALLLAWQIYLNRDIFDVAPDKHLIKHVGFGLILVGAATMIWLSAPLFRARGALAAAALIPIIAFELFLPTLPTRGDFPLLDEGPYEHDIPAIERPQRYDPFQQPPYIQFLREQSGVFRAYGIDRIVHPNVATAYGIQDPRGYNAATVERYINYITTFVDRDAGFRFVGTWPSMEDDQIVGNPFFDLMNAKYLLVRQGQAVLPDLRSPASVPGFTDQFQLVYSNVVDVYENTSVIPRAFLVNDIRPADDMEGALDVMSGASFDPADAAAVEGAPEDLLATTDPSAAIESDVTIESYSDQKVTVRVTTDKPALLVLTDTYYPGWHVKIDGHDATIYPTDVAFRGVFVPEGEHTVEFTYAPASFRTGVAIALLSVLALAGYASYYYRWPRIGGRRR